MVRDEEAVVKRVIFSSVALVVGIFAYFALGVIAGPVAVYNANEAQKSGSDTLAPILFWLGIGEAVLGGLRLLAAIAN